MIRYDDGAWKSAAVRYSVVLRSELARTGMTRTELARRVGVTSTSVGFYCRAAYLPRPEIAAAVAEALCSEPLSKMTTAGAVIRCDNCGRERFRGTSRRRYCGETCRSQANSRKGGATQPTSGIQFAVDQFCRACEPEGVCRMPACQLQPFSPLPLARRASA
jgi:DNA-binding XRE family transcriptional regulator